MIAWAIEALVASTLLMLLVLGLRGPVRRAFGPTVAYALWALPVLRMLMPPLPEEWREHAIAPIAAAGDTITVYLVDPVMGAAPVAADPVVAASAPVDWIGIILLLWGIGTVGFLVWHLIAHSRFCTRIRARAHASRRVADGRVQVIESDAAAGPLAFGIFRKYVAFPRDFDARYDEIERDLALAHELGHHVRGDLIANWVALVVLAFHWFNPVAWRAFRAFRADQEMACDALVLSGRAASLRLAYGRAIVKSAHGGAVSAACHLHTINELKGRLKMLSEHHRRSRRRIAAGTGTIAAIAIASLALTASGTRAAERIRSEVATHTGVDLTAIDLPKLVQDVPPAPPAPPAPAPSRVPPAPLAPPAPVLPAPGVVPPPPAPVPPVARVVPPRPAPPAPPAPPVVDVPQVVSRTCGPASGGTREVVIERKDGQTRTMVICTDRIAVMTADAEALAMKQKGMAMMHARLGLKSARMAIERDTTMTADQKSLALAGIDQAMREIERQKDD